MIIHALLFFIWLTPLLAQRQPWPIKVDRFGSCCSRLPSSQTSSTNIGIHAKVLQSCLSEITTAPHAISKSSSVSIVSLIAPGFGEHVITDIDLYSSFHEAVVGAYAEFKGYTFQAYSKLPEEIESYKETDFRWNKIPLLMQALNTWAKDSEYMVWIDSDAVVTDFNFDVLSFANLHPNAEFFASADIRMGLINTGFFILKNTPWGRQFLHDWWSVSDRKHVCDQDAFDMLYKSLLSAYSRDPTANTIADIREKVVILPMNVLNSHPPAWKYHSEQNRVVHLMGESAAYRALIFQEAYRSICKARSGGVLPPQLGITRDLMLLHGQRIYRDETQRTFMKANETGSIHDIEELSKASHHYVDILQHIASQQQKKLNANTTAYNEEILYIREGVFNLIVENVKLQRRDLQYTVQQLLRQPTSVDLINHRMETLQQIVSLLKKAAESGNALFWATNGLENRKLVGQRVLEILDDLLLRVIDEHKARPMHMKALMLQNLGMTLYEHAMQYDASTTSEKTTLSSSTESSNVAFVKKSLFTDAEFYFRESVTMFDDFWKSLRSFQQNTDSAETSIHREYVQSLQLHAGVLCLLRRFEEGIGEWQRAVQWAEAIVQDVHIGFDYEKLGLIYYNAAVCHAEHGHVLSMAENNQGGSRDVSVLLAGYDMVQRSASIFKDILSKHAAYHQAHQVANDDDKQSFLGSDEITDLRAFLNQVLSLKDRLIQRLRDLGREPLPSSDDGSQQQTQAQKPTAHPKEQEVPPPKSSPKMQRVIQPDGSVKFVLMTDVDSTDSSSSPSSIAKVTASHGEEEEEDEWEECSEIDDADCLAFEVEDGPNNASQDIQRAEQETGGIFVNITDDSNAKNAPKNNSSHDAEAVGDEGLLSEDDYIYDDDYGEYDDDYYYEDYSEEEYSATSTSKDIGTDTKGAVNDDETALYEGLSEEEISDLKDARARQQRLYFQNEESKPKTIVADLLTVSAPAITSSSSDAPISTPAEKSIGTEESMKKRLHLLETMLVETMEENASLRKQLEELQKR